MGDIPESGRVSRRALLTGAGSLATLIVAGGVGADIELDRHPTWRGRLFGCGVTPPIPRSTYTVTTGTTWSPAMNGLEQWEVAVPADRAADEHLPLVLVLPGEGGQASQLVGGVGLVGYASEARLRMVFACPGGAADTYYHPRRNGTNELAWITDELLPMVERRFDAGGSKASTGVYGSSMGGFGALLIAQKRPDLVSAVVAASPAVFPTYHAAITGHPDTFDSPADWAQWGVWNQAGSIRDVAVTIQCGNSDPFASTARKLLTRIPGATGSIESGCHRNSFWRPRATQALHFLASHLSANT